MHHVSSFRVMDTFEVFDYEACHGMRIVLDIHAAVEAEKQKAASEAGTLSPVECVAKRAGRRVDEINRFGKYEKKDKNICFF